MNLITNHENFKGLMANRHRSTNHHHPTGKLDLEGLYANLFAEVDFAVAAKHLFFTLMLVLISQKNSFKK